MTRTIRIDTTPFDTADNADDIDFDNRVIVIKVQKMRKRDGKAIERRRVVPIDRGTLDLFEEYLERKLRVCQDNESCGGACLTDT